MGGRRERERKRDQRKNQERGGGERKREIKGKTKREREKYRESSYVFLILLKRWLTDLEVDFHKHFLLFVC